MLQPESVQTVPAFLTDRCPLWPVSLQRLIRCVTYIWHGHALDNLSENEDSPQSMQLRYNCTQSCTGIQL